MVCVVWEVGLAMVCVVWEVELESVDGQQGTFNAKHIGYTDITHWKTNA